MTSQKLHTITNGLVILSLLFLAVFLAFWIKGEYEANKKALQNEIMLKVTAEWINSRSYSLLDSLEATSNSTFEKIDSASSLGTLILDSDKADGFFKIEGIEYKGDSESVEGHIATQININTKDGTSSQIRTGNLPEKWQLKMNEVPLQAFFQLIPQIIFAFFLVLLFSTTIFLIKRSERERQLALETQQQFISNMTHELKTPVATIGVALEALQDFNLLEDKDKSNAYISMSRQELKRLTGLINQVLLFAKSEQQGKSIYKMQTVNLSTLLSEVLRSMQLPIQKKGATIETAIAVDLTLQGDATHLANAFRNLLDNALKYSEQGVIIELIARREKEQLVIVFRDNGWGIPEVYQKQIFDQFFRVPTGNLHNVKGYGLGLSYVAEVVKAHGGNIELKSREGEGTEMRVTIDDKK